MTATERQELREALMLLDAVTVARDRAESERDSLQSTLKAVRENNDQLRALNLALTKDLSAALARIAA